MAGELSPFKDGIPVVVSTNERNSLFPAPATNQRVQNLETAAIERYDGTQWVTDLSLAGSDVHSITDPRYGASPSASAAVNTAAIQAAATAAGTTGVLKWEPGTFATNSTLTITGACWMEGPCTLNYTGTGDCLHVGDGSALLQSRLLRLPAVVSASKPTTGWTGAGDTGILLRKVFDCEIYMTGASGFTTGVKFYGVSGEGCDHNEVHLGYLNNNKVNLKIDSATDGWCNENLFDGGRLAHAPAEGTAVSGTRQIQILGNVGGVIDLFNNHRFNDVSLEGDVPEYHVETKASDCVWEWCRWETNGTTPKFLSSGTNAMNNTVRGGQNAHNIVFTTTAGGQQPRVESREGLTIAGAGTNSVIKTANHNGNTSPIIRAYPAGTDLFGASIGTNWVWELTASTLKGKATGDATASPRWQIDPAVGTITTKGGLASGLANVIANLDSSAFQQTIANTVTFTGPTMAAGIVFLWDSNSGHGAVVWLPNGVGIVISGTDNGSVYSGTIGTASKFNVAISSGALKIQNNSGASASMSGIVFKLA